MLNYTVLKRKKTTLPLTKTPVGPIFEWKQSLFPQKTGRISHRSSLLTRTTIHQQTFKRKLGSRQDVYSLMGFSPFNHLTFCQWLRFGEQCVISWLCWFTVGLHQLLISPSILISQNKYLWMPLLYYNLAKYNNWVHLKA